MAVTGQAGLAGLPGALGPEAELGSLQWLLGEAKVDWEGPSAQVFPELQAHQHLDPRHLDRVVNSALVEHLTERLTLPRPVDAVHKSGQVVEDEVCCIPARTLWAVPLVVLADLVHGVSWPVDSCCTEVVRAAPEHCPAQADTVGRLPAQDADGDIRPRPESPSQVVGDSFDALHCEAVDCQHEADATPVQAGAPSPSAVSSRSVPSSREAPARSDMEPEPLNGSMIDPQVTPRVDEYLEELVGSALPSAERLPGEVAASSESAASADQRHGAFQSAEPSASASRGYAEEESTRRCREPKTVVTNLQTNSKASSILGPLLAARKKKARQAGEAQSAVL